VKSVIPKNTTIMDQFAARRTFINLVKQWLKVDHGGVEFNEYYIDRLCEASGVKCNYLVSNKLIMDGDPECILTDYFILDEVKYSWFILRFTK
jgi:hypothetical protein